MKAIVIVDSPQGYLAGFSGELTRAGFDVLHAECVPSALAHAAEHSAEAIIMYERASVLDVTDLLRLRRLRPEVAGIPVMVAATSPAAKLECFRLGCEEFIELPRDEPELLFRLHNMLRRGERLDIEASLKQIPLVDVVQMLSSGRKTGEANIGMAGGIGRLLFEDGQIVHAQFEGEQGEQALLALLRATGSGGRLAFRVREDLVREPRTINKRTDHLLLSSASVLDESGT